MTVPNSTTLRAIIYCRVSGPGQATVPEQEQRARKLAEQKGWPIVDVVKDDGIAGDVADRPGLSRLEMLFQMHQKAGTPINLLMVAHTDRLSRSDTIDAFEILARLRRAGLRYVVTEQREIDLQSNLDRTLWSLEQDHSSHPFLAMNATRAMNGMIEVAKAGFWVGSPPLGYYVERLPNAHGAGKRRRSGVLRIDPETAPVILELFRRYDEGASTITLADWLTTQVPPRRRTRWSYESVRQILRNKVYIGILIFGRKSRGKHVRLRDGVAIPQDHSGKKNLAAAICLPGAVPAIIDEQLFQRVQARLSAAKKQNNYHLGAAPLPLAGLGKCGHCGAAIHAVRHTRAHKDGIKIVRRRLLCSNRNQFGKIACTHGPVGASHDFILVKILNELANSLLAGGTAERLALLADEQAADATRIHGTTISTLTKKIAQLDSAITHAQDRLFSLPHDLMEDGQIALRRLKQQRADTQAELDLASQTAVKPDFDPARFRAFWEAVKKAQAIAAKEKGEYPPSLRSLLAEIVESYTLYCKPNAARGHQTPDRIEIVLPQWLTSLASHAGANCKLCYTIRLD